MLLLVLRCLQAQLCGLFAVTSSTSCCWRLRTCRASLAGRRCCWPLPPCACRPAGRSRCTENRRAVHRTTWPAQGCCADLSAELRPQRLKSSSSTCCCRRSGCGRWMRTTNSIGKSHCSVAAHQHEAHEVVAGGRNLLQGCFPGGDGAEKLPQQRRLWARLRFALSRTCLQGRAAGDLPAARVQAPTCPSAVCCESTLGNTTMQQLKS